MEHLDTIAQLIEKHRTGTLTTAEHAELQEWIHASPEHAAIFETIEQGGALPYLKELYRYQTADNSLRQRIAASLPAFRLQEETIVAPVAHRVHFLRTAWFRYAAIILLVAGTSTFVYLNQEAPKEIVQAKKINLPDILPGGNKATLSLADGSTIVLDSAGTGTLAQQGNMQVIKLDGGKLAYQGAAGGAVLYNTISTPKGGQYQVVLPDGSKVWLNAASSIRFPTSFTNERTVEITGESYLEVANDKTKPFFVKTGKAVVQVLGTSFNVNAYPEEQVVKVSLLEGSVKVGQVMLKPGEAWEEEKVIITDIQQDVAWKNGIFDFRGQGLAEVMRQLERWYAIEVVYERGINNLVFGGKLSKGVSLNSMLKGLQESGVHCKLEGRRLIVTP